MATVLDVAKRAGVSPMTVSRVVNGSGPVSPKLRARVEKALKETGYVPNTVARNLRTKRTDTIGPGHARHHQPLLHACRARHESLVGTIEKPDRQR